MIAKLKKVKRNKKQKEKIIEFKLAEIEVNFEKNDKKKLINEIKDSIEQDGFSSTVSKYSISSSNLNDESLAGLMLML